jgi:hypothetical protein
MDHVLSVDILSTDNPKETMTKPLEDHQTTMTTQTTITKTTAHHHQVQDHRHSNNSNKEVPAAAEAVFYPPSHLYLAVSAEAGQARAEHGIAGQQATVPGNQRIISNSREDGRIPYRPRRILIRNYGNGFVRC